MTAKPPPAPEEQAPPEPPESDAPAMTLAADDGEPGLTWDEYLEQRRELEGRLVALAARVAGSPRFPRWLYHASLAPRIVASRAERQALGPGWQVTPL